MGFGGRSSGRQRSGTATELQLSTQARKADGVDGSRQSHVVQKLQSICVHVSAVASCDRQPAMQVEFDEQILLRKLVNGCAEQSVWTRANSASQPVAAVLSSQPMNCPPPQRHSIWGLHSFGHQQEVVCIWQRSEASQQSQTLSDEQAAVGVDPSGPPVPLIEPPQPIRPSIRRREPLKLMFARMEPFN